MSEIISFGEWAQVRRNQLRLSRTDLARQVGCSPVTIKKIERDERRPSVQIAELLAQHLQIPETEQEDFIHRARGGFVALLAHAPDIKILTTSRERLNLQEEWLFALQGLPYSQGEMSAVQLFAQRAQQVKADFNLEREETAVLRICQLVEGMPLGLELAASWVLQLPCQEIADEIEAELDFLVTELRNVPERQRSIRAVFGYSWEKLSKKERDVLQKLSVFRGGFERKAAKVVAGASLTVLAGLVGKSLLSVGGNGRYQLHELLRQFVAEKLEQSVLLNEETHIQHAQYFMTFASDQEPRIKGAEAKSALVAITEDIDNVRVAIRWALRDQVTLFDRSFGMTMWMFYEVKGWLL
ncbi:MAG: XRE family transcriptional regulator, partial [Chloroflexi bacterium]|nr:XRE family transcriptional regulator [Chloroflexota bacterium]